MGQTNASSFNQSFLRFIIKKSRMYTISMYTLLIKLSSALQQFRQKMRYSSALWV